MADRGKVEQVRKSQVGAATVVLVGGGAGIAFAPLAFTPLAAADPDYLAFLSPSGNISCEINYQRAGLSDGTYCQIVSPPQSVHMDPSGVLAPCTGDSCLGNAAVGTPTLGYGQTIGKGPFTCRSEVSGVTCTVASGRGFTISASGVTPVG
jgi:hypothetical protein